MSLNKILCAIILITIIKLCESKLKKDEKTGHIIEFDDFDEYTVNDCALLNWCT